MPPDVTKTTEQPLTGRVPNWILGTVAAIALIGFSDCVFLLAKGISGGPIPCFITTGCDTVTTSPYSVLLGVHLYAWGIAYYLSMGFLALLYWDTKKEFFIKILSYATIAGFIVSAYYMYIQKFVIKALCIYCITSALTSTILFALGMTILRKLKK